MAKKKSRKKATKKRAAAKKRRPAKKGARKAKKKVTKRKTTKRATKKRATKKRATKKRATKKKASKKKKAKKRKPNPAFMRALTPSAKLAAVVGSKPLPRTEVMKKIWAYIKKRDLQDPKSRRDIIADDTLRALFGKPRANMFELTKIVSKHLK